MFSKASRPPAGVPEAAAAPRAAVGVPSIVSADLRIIGDLKSSGDIQVDGSVEGDIDCRNLTVGEGARVRGKVVAEAVRIYGSVAGEIRAASVQLTRTARVDGDIVQETLSMEAGASLAGKIGRLNKSAPGRTGKPGGEKASPGAGAAPNARP